MDAGLFGIPEAGDAGLFRVAYLCRRLSLIELQFI